MSEDLEALADLLKIPAGMVESLAAEIAAAPEIDMDDLRAQLDLIQSPDSNP
ncbi:hypothetical protein [Thiocapsa bogorovii]|uniref:hypothetical protein n=1 Tax=Thiocapsa bogorovii TaxID=521689 RepID=UPI001E53996F|nr:hypothetical protein [Thiocapsa bogorovii]UHD15720.1 hypothetical protein LT988_21065 [Thiocapsa bogorovii]